MDGLEQRVWRTVFFFLHIFFFCELICAEAGLNVSRFKFQDELDWADQDSINAIVSLSANLQAKVYKKPRVTLAQKTCIKKSFIDSWPRKI
jgi:hypothetical protein